MLYYVILEITMSEELIIEHCSPTLAGIKTGSLFSVKIKEQRIQC